MVDRPKVAFIACTHNNRAIVDDCLLSIRRQTRTDYQTVFIDDASTDGTPDWIESQHPWVTVIRNEHNCGPSKLRNVAAGTCESEYLAFLDSDVDLEPNWLESILAPMEQDPSIAMVGGKLFYASGSGRLHAYGGAMSLLGIGWNRYDGEPDPGLCTMDDSLWVSSAACVIRRSVFDEIGGFDPTYFYGYEDSDLGWRVCLAGYRVVCVPEAVAYHKVSETVDKLGARIVYHYHKNRLRSVLKNYGPANLLRYLPLWAAYTAVDVALRNPRGAKLRALGWNIRHLPETLRLRAQTQGSRKRSDRQLSKLFTPRLLPKRTLRARRKSGAAALAVTK